MSSTSEKSSSTSQSFLSAQTLVISGIAWGVLALLYFLLFSGPDKNGAELPTWYVIGTYVFECSAFLAAAILCLRNWRSPQIVSGRNVWLGLGLGVFSYLIGNLLFGCWELVWGLDPDVSLGDIFYVFSYLFLAWGMILAVISRRLNLELWQWLVLGAIAVGGIALAVWVASPVDAPAQPAPTEQVTSAKTPAAKPPAKAPAIKPTSTSKPAAKAPTPKAAAPEVDEEENPSVPVWVQGFDKQLEPIAYPVNLFYIVGDVFLLIIATALLLAFWGGRFSNSWRMIAAATFSLYIADMWFKYADNRMQGDYQSGSLLEVFFVFSGVLFAIGAVLEYDISTRSRRPGRKRA